jgi:hypothetical protein
MIVSRTDRLYTDIFICAIDTCRFFQTKKNENRIRPNDKYVNTLKNNTRLFDVNPIIRDNKVNTKVQRIAPHIVFSSNDNLYFSTKKSKIPGRKSREEIIKSNIIYTYFLLLARA